jgi:hypothetical protein
VIDADWLNFGGEMVELLYKELTFTVIGAAMEVHKILGPVSLEHRRVIK